MMRLLSRFYCVLAGVAILGLLVAASDGIAAGESGTAEEAKAMVERAVDALKADEAAALAAFTAGEEGFKDRDLYVFCLTDTAITAHGANADLIGQDPRTIMDKAGKNVGEAILAVAKEGELSLVEYMWPRPGETEAVPKASLVTQVGEQACGVGYYQ